MLSPPYASRSCYTNNMKRRTSGFTIVELLIVIVVIAILAAITIVSYRGIQARALDARRESDMVSIRKKLEIFKAHKGYYPSSDDFLGDQTFRNKTLDITDSLITSPGGSKMDYCWATTAHVTDGVADPYCYVPYRARPEASPWAGDCTNAGEQCVGYTLTYWSGLKNQQVEINVGSQY